MLISKLPSRMTEKSKLVKTRSYNCPVRSKVPYRHYNDNGYNNTRS